jgi:hypothetical protein
MQPTCARWRPSTSRASLMRTRPDREPCGKIPRVDPDFGSTLTSSNRNSQSNCWANWKIVGQPGEFQDYMDFRFLAECDGAVEAWWWPVRREEATAR